MTEPVRIAILNDYEVVVAGLAEMLSPFVERVRVVELDLDRRIHEPIDVALYDTFTRTQVDTAEVDEVLAQRNIAAVAVYTWNMHEELVRRAQEKGARGYLSKSLSAQALVEAIERIHAGETIVEPQRDVGHAVDTDNGGNWPGKAEGLSARQAEIVALVTRGFTNEEIGRRAYLSVNTVKSYLRLAYRTMGVTSRSQAILWGRDHGMGRNVEDS